MGFFFRIYVKLFYTRVFVDKMGNEYFLSFNMNHLGVYRRYVLFNSNNKEQDTSKISSNAFLWLHYLVDDFNDNIFKDHKFWYKDNVGNLTGTKDCYDPYLSNHKK